MIDRFETFATTIAFINRYVQKIKSAEMRPLGLKSAYVMCLYNLVKKPEGVTASELCELCGEDKAAVSRTLSELSRRDYVRVDEPDGKRAYRAKVFLTEKGKKIGEYIHSRVDHVLDAVSEGMSELERTELYRSLSVIARNLKRYLQAEAAV